MILVIHGLRKPELSEIRDEELKREDLDPRSRYRNSMLKEML
jgi:hypothetical protein